MLVLRPLVQKVELSVERRRCAKWRRACTRSVPRGQTGSENRKWWLEEADAVPDVGEVGTRPEVVDGEAGQVSTATARVVAARVPGASLALKRDAKPRGVRRTRSCAMS